MSEALDKIRSQLNEYFEKFDRKDKIKIIVVAIMVLGVLTGVILYFSRADYTVLYNDLDPQQAGEVMDTLEANGIRARHGATSSIVEVPVNDEKRAQVVVATEGLPTARFSFEDAFTGGSFMMTSEERTQRMQLAQQNFLASTIEEIQGVRKAVVNIAIPERSGFVLVDDQTQAKASVYLDLHRSAQLEPESVNGIAVLVANAVDGLESNHVTIHGPDGRVLNQDQDSDDTTMDVGNQLSLQRKVQQDLENSITDFLSTVYGYGNVVVMANVKLDFDSEVTEITEFSPPIEDETDGIARSLQELDIRSESIGAGEVPGTDPNTEDIVQYVEQDGYTSTYEEASRTINYEINELRQQIVRAQGQVQDITVAVYLNSNALPDEDLTDDERTELMDIISAAAGLDTRVVQVGVQQFDTPLVPDFDMDPESIIPWWVWVIIALLVTAIAYIAYRRFVRKDEEDEETDEELAPAISSQEELDLEMAGSEVKQSIEKLVNKNPEAIANLLRNWLSED
ncbi:flagellar basal-body MS-ring/collar protein FliF [Tindallia californiensis]|uniref:Flagellar M-ring protein n=1 Tax=Tindallia californiensis TaxID=159292 RepID=A0A1H3NSM7_9FIRM|nr:flagellar basal-body MS-ring/collar protein FliF [Tindallia californiensis]SDY91753.1 flagellar M-ring protein FliF [Tindallia californiensis]